jgi:hypothetical protein
MFIAGCNINEPQSDAGIDIKQQRLTRAKTAKIPTQTEILNLWKSKGFENFPIWSMKLVVEVADVKDAGTNGQVSLSLNGDSKLVLKSSKKKDFQKGKRSVFRFFYPGVTQIKDIGRVQLNLKGTDAVIIKKISLYLNETESPIMAKSFEVPHVLDNRSKSGIKSLAVKYKELRNSNKWKRSNIRAYANVINVMSRSRLEEHIETMLGHELANNPDMKKYNVSWDRAGKQSVDIKRGKTANEVKVDADFKGYQKVSKWISVGTVYFDLDFDCILSFKQSNKKIGLKISNVKVKPFKINYPWWYDAINWRFTFGLLGFLTDMYLQDKAADLDLGIKVMDFSTFKYQPTLKVTKNGDLKVNWLVPVN